MTTLTLRRGLDLSIGLSVAIGLSATVAANCYKNDPAAKCCAFVPGSGPDLIGTSCSTGGPACKDILTSDPTLQQAIANPSNGTVGKATGSTATCAWDEYECNAQGNCVFIRHNDAQCTETHESGDACPNGGGGGDPD